MCEGYWRCGGVPFLMIAPRMESCKRVACLWIAVSFPLQCSCIKKEWEIQPKLFWMCLFPCVCLQKLWKTKNKEHVLVVWHYNKPRLNQQDTSAGDEWVHYCNYKYNRIHTEHIKTNRLVTDQWRHHHHQPPSNVHFCGPIWMIMMSVMTMTMTMMMLKTMLLIMVMSMVLRVMDVMIMTIRISSWRRINITTSWKLLRG